MKRHILFILPTLLIPAAGVAMELNLQPGRLPDIMSKVRTSTDTHLILKGTATSSDLTALRQLPLSIKSLDMSALTVKGDRPIGGSWFGTEMFEDGELPAYMLLGRGVSEIILPVDLKIIGAGAFASTPIEKIKSGTLEKIGEGAFMNCINLKEADFGGSPLTALPARIFSGCGQLKDVMLSMTITRVGSRAFEKSGVENVFLPSVTEMGDYAFSYATNLSEINYSYGCKMGEGVFYGTPSLETIVGAPYNIPVLYSAAGTSAEILSIEASEVEEGAYSGSRGSIIALGKNVEQIGPYAFHSMPNLKKIVAGECNDIPTADPTAFAGNETKNILLYVKRGEIDRWRNAPVWCNFNITDEESGIDDPNSEDSDLIVTRCDDIISVMSAGTIREVSIFAADGKLIYSNSGLSGLFEIPFPAGYEVVIVRVLGEKGVKIAKMIK